MQGSSWVAPWSIDPVHLDSIISAIRAALPSDQGGATVPFSASPLVGRLDGLAKALDQTVLEIQEALQKRQGTVAHTSWLQPAESMEGLTTVVSAIRRAWQDRVGATIDNSVRPTLAQLLTEPAPNLLALLGRKADENSHSDILRWLLSPRHAPNVALAVLNALISRLESPDEWATRIRSALKSDCLSVRREVRMGPETDDPAAADRIDLLVTGPGF